jgi:hypothetical protein
MFLQRFGFYGMGLLTPRPTLLLYPGLGPAVGSGTSQVELLISNGKLKYAAEQLADRTRKAFNAINYL